MNTQNPNYKIATLASGNLETTTVRITTEIAKEWLLDNTHVTNKGTVYPIQIRDLGLGVYEAKLNPYREDDTRLISHNVNAWIVK